MDDDAAKRDSTVYAMGLLALTGCGVAILASGGVAVFALAIAAACLAGSIAASLASVETKLERYGRECDEVEATADAEPLISPAQEVAQSYAWRQSVTRSQQKSRARQAEV